jgi:hypothetical protein
MGQHDEARTDLNRAIELDPVNAWAYVTRPQSTDMDWIEALWPALMPDVLQTMMG